MNDTVPFTNFSCGIQYHSDISLQFSKQLFRPLIDIIQHHIFLFLSKSPGFVLSALRNHNNFSDPATLKHGFYVTIMYMLPGYILMVAGILAAFVSPIVCYKRLPSKNYINVFKYQTCFCIEGFLFIIACVFLAFGTTGSIQAAINVDESIESYPNLGRLAVDDVHGIFDLLKTQLDVLRHDMCIVLENKLQCLIDLPIRIMSVTNQLLYPFMPDVEINFQLLYKNFEDAVSNSGIMNTNHSLLLAMEGMNTRLQEVRLYLYFLKNKVLRDNGFTMEEKRMLSQNISLILRNFSSKVSKITVPNWSEIGERLNNVSVYMSVVNYSAHFTNMLPQKIENAIAHIVSRTEFKRREIQKWADKSLMDLDNITETFLPGNFLYHFKKLMYQLDYAFSYLDMRSGQHSGFSGQALLVLVPGFHGLIVLFFISIASIVGTHEIRRLMQRNHENPMQYKTSYGAKILHCGTVVGLTLLWLHLLLAGIFYVGSITLSMFCLPTMDATIFTKYFDDVKVWNNRTLIDSLMQEHVSHYSEGIKVMEVLQKCQNNETLYKVLNMEKYWDLKKYMKMDTVRLETSEIIEAVESGMKKVTLPNLEFLKLSAMDLEYIVQAIDLNFISELEEEIKKFHMNMSTEIIMETLKNIPQRTKYDYVQDELRIVLYEIENIKRINIGLVLGNISLIRTLKESLQQFRKDLLNVIPAFSNVTSIMKQSSHFIREHVHGIIATEDKFTSRFVEHAEQSVTTDIGKCRVFYVLFRKMTYAVCKTGLQILIGVWLSLGLMSVSMIISLLLGCRISRYFRGAHDVHFLWQRRLHVQKCNQCRLIKSDALLFDEKGGFIGNAVMLSSNAKNLPISPSAITLNTMYQE